MTKKIFEVQFEPLIIIVESESKRTDKIIRSDFEINETKHKNGAHK